LHVLPPEVWGRSARPNPMSPASESDRPRASGERSQPLDVTGSGSHPPVINRGAIGPWRTGVGATCASTQSLLGASEIREQR
jgi:hypothetical protein